MKKPGVLIVHNTYFHRGGEDSVVEQEVLTLKKLGYPVFTLFFDNNAFKKSSPKAFFLPLNLFFNISAFVKVYRAVKKNGIRFVHVHNLFYTASPSVLWAGKAAGAFTLLSIHNYRLFCLNGFFFREKETCMLCHEQKSFKPGIRYRCFKGSALFSSMLASVIGLHRRIGTWQSRVDRFIVLNSLVYELLLQAGITPGKLYLKPNFLKQELERGIDNSIPRQDFYLFVGRISEEKGIRHLVDAFKTNGRKLKLVGDGPLTGWLQKQTGSNIEYHEAIKREELFVWYASCKALVFTSLWPEGHPMTLIEAQSVGTPVIAAESAITREMVGARYGLLYSSGDASGLNRAIDTFEQLSTQDREQMSADIYSHFLTHYTEMQHISAVAEMYATGTP